MKKLLITFLTSTLLSFNSYSMQDEHKTSFIDLTTEEQQFLKDYSWCNYSNEQYESLYFLSHEVTFIQETAKKTASLDPRDFDTLSNIMQIAFGSNRYRYNNNNEQNKKLSEIIQQIPPETQLRYRNEQSKNLSEIMKIFLGSTLSCRYTHEDKEGLESNS